ncbi:phosphoadenosine phosphosulfate reductase [uncultured Roseovarius sp.]|uniref:phosphoadenosine phosphosulfate reductase n=1 Tax=uncultured Roseovarius sp. TaxID=293344 RepID=UPI00260627B3|nr:phosphoadenosine phosphosulfate reductase [uncultured Roseovarius sp.]
MQDSPDIFDTDLSGLDWDAWCERANALAGDDGYAEPLGDAHAAVLIEREPKTLLVTFETHHRLSEISPKAQPLGWALTKALGWSHLCLISKRDTWFRDGMVYGYFDRLIDDGFFDEFDEVIFYGAGACGYAAAAFSVASPGAKVVMLRPQATLDPRVTEWDDRYLRMRRTSFTNRYGYAPDMLDAASEAVLLYDPDIDLDAMHAALFTRSNVLKFRTRHLGYQSEKALLRMGVIFRLLAQIRAGKLTPLSLAQLYRKRRDDTPYLFSVLQRLMSEERDLLAMMHCRNAIARRVGGPRFRKALNMLRAKQDPQ